MTDLWQARRDSCRPYHRVLAPSDSKVRIPAFFKHKKEGKDSC